MRFNVAVLFLAAIYSSSPGQAARILGLFPTPSISHQVVFRAVMEELTKRGLQIVTLTANLVHYKDGKFEHIMEIDVHKVSYDIILNTVVPADMKKQFGHPRNSIPFLMNMLLELADLQMSVPKMKAILKSKYKYFYFIFVEGFAPINHVAGAWYKSPVISINSVSAMFADFDAIESPSHPILYADIFSLHVGELDFWQRLDSVYGNLLQRYYSWIFSDQFNKVARKHNGADAPTVEEAQRQMSMLFLNAHPILTGIRPAVPAVVYIGGSHLKLNKTITKGGVAIKNLTY